MNNSYLKEKVISYLDEKSAEKLPENLLLIYLNSVSIESIDWNDWFIHACIKGYFNIANLLIEKGILAIENKNDVPYYLNKGLACSCEGGHHDLIELMVKKGANNWNWALRSACLGGHRDIVELMIEKGANDWDCGLTGACESGHRDLVELMIEKGSLDWNWGLAHACCGGHRDLVDLMIQKGASAIEDRLPTEASFRVDWNLGLESACREGHSDLVKLMIEKGADTCDSFCCKKTIEEHLS